MVGIIEAMRKLGLEGLIIFELLNYLYIILILLEYFLDIQRETFEWLTKKKDR
jgi:hypothetical protein